MKAIPLLLGLALLTLPHGVQAQYAQEVPTTQEHQAIRTAILHYAEGLYTRDPERIKQGVHPDVAKIGYWRPHAETWYRTSEQDFDKLLELAKTWNADGHVDAATAPRQITILDVLDQTAAARLDAEWGIDYLHLAKIEGQWMIMQVIWQTRPAGYMKQSSRGVKQGGS